MTARITVDRAVLADLCRHCHIRRLSFFGSVLRDDFNSKSDVDILVEFSPQQIPGFLRLAKIEAELSQLLGGRRVDLLTPKFINHRLRKRVLESAELAYAEE
jgi:predicted nucleotidyltransferase